MKVRIFYHHTDCGGVVYYGRYLNFLEEARTEYFEKLGFDMAKLVTKEHFFVVARQEIDYKAPAVYGDLLEIDTWVGSVSNVRVNFEYTIKTKEGKLISKAKTVLVYIGGNFRPTAMPDDVIKKIESSIPKGKGDA